MRFNQLLYMLAVLAVSLLIARGAKADSVFLIDGFSSGAFTSPTAPTYDVKIYDDGYHADVIGGYRDVLVGGMGDPVIGYSGQFSYQNAGTSRGGYVQYQYDGYGKNGDLNLNLLDVGTDGYFTFHDFVAVDYGLMGFDVTDSSGLGYEISWQFYNNNTDTFGHVYDDLVIPYSWIMQYGVDFSDIKSIQLHIFAPYNTTQVSFSSITATTIAVPEPASMSILGLGSVLLLCRRRRQRA